MQGTKFSYGVFSLKKTFKWKSFYFDYSIEILFHVKIWATVSYVMQYLTNSQNYTLYIIAAIIIRYHRQHKKLLNISYQNIVFLFFFVHPTSIMYQLMEHILY